MGVTQNEGMTILGDLKRKTFIILNLTPYVYIYIYNYIYTWFISLSYLSYNPELSQCVKDIICLLHHRKPKRHQGAKPWYPLLS